ncbi:MAG: ISKra4 family transposase ISAcas1 [Chroococcidiopsis sp. SAG 2025]|nr:ISKra4 family transposase ISAcas1 [Chroococcidiopsis sp. SAG 2025]
MHGFVAESGGRLPGLGIHLCCYASHHAQTTSVRIYTSQTSSQVGATLSQATLREPSAQECAAPTTDLIVQVDGGHIPVKQKGKRSFEALSAIAYQPDNIKQVDQNHRQITNKTCVVSTLNDELDTIKSFVLNAAHKQGMTEQTRVTGLADGANNCWSVVLSLKSHCLDLECILDWFHIGQKFQNVKNALGESFEESLDSVKWAVWHGEVQAALTKLKLLQDNITDNAKQSKIQGLLGYLKNNLNYLINYEQRKNSGKVYTSQTVESQIDLLINARHKRKQKMQWTREGAHNVLQIRAKMESHEWNRQWQDAVLEALIGAA